MSSKKLAFILAILAVAVVVGAVLALCVGEKSYSLAKLLALFLGDKSNFEAMVLMDIRLPRVIAALVIGASLSLSGTLYQGVMGNVLVSPSILGVLSGASFGAALAMLFGWQEAGIESLSFIFGLLAMGLSLLLSYLYGGGYSVLMLILSGMIISSIFGAGLSLLKLEADPYNTLPSIVYWLMGSLTNVSYPLAFISLFILILSFIASLYLSKALDILNLGDEEAMNLGVDARKLRLMSVIVATMLASTSVALGGLIGWVGLIIPHIARFIVGNRHFYVICFATLFGAIFLLACDSIARTALSTEIPIGIITSLISVPIFAFILWIRRTS